MRSHNYLFCSFFWIFFGCYVWKMCIGDEHCVRRLIHKISEQRKEQRAERWHLVDGNRASQSSLYFIFFCVLFLFWMNCISRRYTFCLETASIDIYWHVCLLLLLLLLNILITFPLFMNWLQTLSRWASAFTPHGCVCCMHSVHPICCDRWERSEFMNGKLTVFFCYWAKRSQITNNCQNEPALKRYDSLAFYLYVFFAASFAFVICLFVFWISFVRAWFQLLVVSFSLSISFACSRSAGIYVSN